MRLTAEIRWFWLDRPPQKFHGWFVGAGAAWTAAGSIKTRVDEYLRDPDQDSLGIKKRGRHDGDLEQAQSFLSAIARSLRVTRIGAMQFHRASPVLRPKTAVARSAWPQDAIFGGKELVAQKLCGCGPRGPGT
jgi:hypothetical protein